MNIFNRMFGARTPLDRMRRALKEQRWADALSIGEDMDVGLEGEEPAERDELMVQACDGLARLNIDEAEGCLRAGDRGRASEHLDLAAAKVRSPALAEKITELRNALGTTGSAPPVATPVGGGHCASGCAGNGANASRPGAEFTEDADALDPEGRYELILAGYPPALATRYHNRSDEFRRAFMLAHEGSDEEALDRFENIPPGERDDLYHFEKGALLGRMRQVSAARRELETAVSGNAANTLAHETLVDLELSSGEEVSAKNRLESLLNQGVLPAFCHSRLALLALRSGDRGRALKNGLAALEKGFSEPDIVLLTSSLLEDAGRLDEAESLLMRLSGGGCSGGINVSLAEFWLRRGKHPDKALEIFKGAVRQDPENPRWPFRMAESYLAIGWRKEGLRLLEKALIHPRLEPELKKLGQALLSPGS